MTEEPLSQAQVDLLTKCDMYGRLYSIVTLKKFKSKSNILTHPSTLESLIVRGYLRRYAPDAQFFFRRLEKGIGVVGVNVILPESYTGLEK